MINKGILEKVLKCALNTGGDFAEVFIEDTSRNSIIHQDGKLEKALSGRDYGAGVRIFMGFRSVYAYTNDVSEQGLLRTAEKAAAALNGSPDGKDIVLVDQPFRVITNYKTMPVASLNLQKTEKVREAYAAAKAYHSEISQVLVNYGDVHQHIQVANSEGNHWQDERVRTRLVVQCVASDENGMQTGMEGPGRQMGMEFFEHVDTVAAAREAARSAVTMLKAPECPAGVMTVAIDNGFGGVIFHEACGHALEATAVAKGNSVFCGKLGQQIACKKLTAIDDGTIPNAWGSLNIDDEGTPSKKNVLIEDGILKGYMIDKMGARRMGLAPTGSGRRQSYKFAPTSRMTNTYIAAGNDDEKEIISSMAEGLYAKKMGGGSVNPVTGEFNFAVSEGYLVKNGEITSPVRGATLIGKGEEVLMKIDRIGKNLAMGQGMCGSISGSIPTNVGQPMIRVCEMTVGGRKGEA